MSLSRPARFPVLKLPFLCIESVIKSLDTFDIIYFALFSKRTRRIVKHLKIPLNNIKIYLSDRTKCIYFNNYARERWLFRKNREKLFHPVLKDLGTHPLVLQNNSIPVNTSKADDKLHSYTDGSTITALKMTMEFLNELFIFSVEKVIISEDNFPESGDIGVKSAFNLCIDDTSGHYARSQQLNLLLGNLEVTGKCDFWVKNTETDFYCDPKHFKCKQLVFWMNSDWITLEILCQFDVPQLTFWSHRLTNQDIVSYVTHWFNSENRKLEYVEIHFNKPITIDDFKIGHLNPMPFCEKRRDRYVSIYFALISKKTRQIVKHLKIPLNGIKVLLSETKWIEFGDNNWGINSTNLHSLFDEHQSLRKNSLVLQKNAIPLYFSKTYGILQSYTDGNGFIALKMALEFLNEVFKCSVEGVDIYGDNFPESGDIGVKSAVNLLIDYRESHPFGQIQNQKLNSLLENLEVTGTCSFWVTNTENDLYCDPKLFKCKKLAFWLGSAAWVTREILMQFEVPQLRFFSCHFTVEDIAAFVTQWFHSVNKKLEYFHIHIYETQLSMEDFQTEQLNPLPFSERNRVPRTETFRNVDFSKGLDIVRHDGLQATIHADNSEEGFLFYIWHDQPAITQN